MESKFAYEIMRYMLRDSSSFISAIVKLKEHLGTPDDIGQGMGKVKIQKYFGGYLELSYLKTDLILIALYFHPNNLTTHNTFKSPGFSLGVEEFINELGMSIDDVEVIHEDGEGFSLRLDSKIFVVGSNNKIESVQLTI